jgi:hypothetical protein
MSTTVFKPFWAVAISLGAMISLTESAYAVAAVPGPIVGVGLPVLVVVGAGYWIARKLRSWNRSG